MARFVHSMWPISAIVFEDRTTCGWQHLVTGNGVGSDNTPKSFFNIFMKSPNVVAFEIGIMIMTQFFSSVDLGLGLRT